MNVFDWVVCGIVLLVVVCVGLLYWVTRDSNKDEWR
jgi:hypothetical protein